MSVSDGFNLYIGQVLADFFLTGIVLFSIAAFISLLFLIVAIVDAVDKWKKRGK